MPDTQIVKEKIEKLPFLINKMDERNRDLKTPLHALLIGAGCSLSCKIPLGATLIELCKVYSFIKRKITNSDTFFDDRKNKFDLAEIMSKIEEKKLKDLYSKYLDESIELLHEKIIKEKDTHLKHISVMFDAEEIKWEDYESLLIKDHQYGFWMDRFSQDPRERQRFIEQIIDGRPPTGAYIFLSYLIERGVFTNLLTTNFDDLINEALMYYTNVRCRFYADDELSQFISIHSSKPNIIKLHGDYRFANIKNTVVETDQLSRNLKMKFEELLGQLGLIIVGYNGADHSIMSVLYEIKKKWKFSLIWCGIDANNVHWRVARLINNTSNSYFVQIESFDALIGQLVGHYLSDPPKDIVETAKEKMQEVGSFLNQFKIEFKKSDVSQSEKEKLEKTLDIWEILKKANESTIDDQKFDLYNQFIKLDDTSAVAYRNRGFIYKKFNQYDKAIEDYSKAINLLQNDPILYTMRAEIYIDLGKYNEAIEDCNQAIAINDKHIYAYNDRGFALLFVKKYDEAIIDFNKAFELDKNYKNPYCHICVAYAKKGNYEEALENVNIAISLAPYYGRAYFNRANVYKLMAQVEKADEDFRKAKEISSLDVLKEQEKLWALI